MANGIAASYIEHSYNIRILSSISLSKFMEQQIEELRVKMEGSSARLAQLERELNVVNPEEKTNILSARLLQLNTEYTKAQADRVRTEAVYLSTRSGTLEAAQVSGQGDELKKLTQNWNEARQNFAEIAERFGANHPEYRKAQALIRELESQVDLMRQNIARQVGVEYQEALDRETMLEKDVADTKADYDKLNLRSFEYQRAKREAEADKNLYEELVRKIREAGINAGFQNNTVRVADSARPAWKQVFPKLWLNLLLAFLLSADPLSVRAPLTLRNGYSVSNSHRAAARVFQVCPRPLQRAKFYARCGSSASPSPTMRSVPQQSNASDGPNSGKRTLSEVAKSIEYP